MFGDLYDKGIKVFTVGVRRIAPDAIDVRAKTLNYLNNILAKIQANIAGHDEALLLNHLGYVCEGTGDNIFIIKNVPLIDRLQRNRASARNHKKVYFPSFGKTKGLL